MMTMILLLLVLQETAETDNGRKATFDLFYALFNVIFFENYFF